GLAAYINIILAREREPAIASNAENGETGAEHFDSPAVAHQKRLDAGRNHHAGTRINGESTQLNAVPVDVLDQRRLAGVLIDREDGDAVFTAGEYLLASEIDRGGRPVSLIYEPAVRVQVDSAGALLVWGFRVGEGFLDEHRLTRKPGRCLSFVDIELVLAL